MAILPVDPFREVYILRLVVGGAYIEPKPSPTAFFVRIFTTALTAALYLLPGLLITSTLLISLDFRRSSSAASRI